MIACRTGRQTCGIRNGSMQCGPTDMQHWCPRVRPWSRVKSCLISVLSNTTLLKIAPLLTFHNEPFIPSCPWYRAKLKVKRFNLATTGARHCGRRVSRWLLAVMTRPTSVLSNGTSSSRLLFPHPLAIACSPSHIRLNLLTRPHRTFLMNQRCVLCHGQQMG